ncbi:hypothetical protein KEM52_002223 [Ascosphaera acerosa]|nr:hypothetical protein KEM52_002223 [Ascosphaera acerosa]
MQNEMHATPMKVVAFYLPMLVGGIALPAFLGLYLHRISGTVLLLVCNAAWITLALLFAYADPAAPYWQYIFPSMICGTLGIDIVWDISHIFITTNQPAERQGLCGALINSILHLGIAVLLGVADIIHEAVLDRRGGTPARRAVFWFQFACAIASGVLMVFFVRIKPQAGELTVDEKRALEERKRQRELALARAAEGEGGEGEGEGEAARVSLPSPSPGVFEKEVGVVAREEEGGA